MESVMEPDDEDAAFHFDERATEHQFNTPPVNSWMQPRTPKPTSASASGREETKFKQTSVQNVNRITKIAERRDRKDRRQRARNKERVFKEVDSVMETLGILSLEAPGLAPLTSVEAFQYIGRGFVPTSSSVSLAASEAGSAVSERGGGGTSSRGGEARTFNRSSTSSLTQALRDSSLSSPQVNPSVSWASVARSSHQRTSSSPSVPSLNKSPSTQGTPLNIPTANRESISSARSMSGKPPGGKGKKNHPPAHQGSTPLTSSNPPVPPRVPRTESSPAFSPNCNNPNNSRRGGHSSSGLPTAPPQATAPTSHWEKLVQERANWQRKMNDALEGRLSMEDVETLVQETLSKAEDLAQQLVVLETPPSGVKELDARLDWLVDATKSGKDILHDLGAHRDLLKQWWRDEAAQEKRRAKDPHSTNRSSSSSSASPHDRICLLVAPEMVSVCHLFSSVCADIILAVTTEEESKAASKVANKLIGAAKAVSNFLRDPCDSTSTAATLSALDKRLSEHVICCTTAASDCSAQIAETLFAPHSLLAGQGGRSDGGAAAARLAHETMARCKVLQSLWKTGGEISNRISRQWPTSRSSLNKRLLNCIHQATECALHMITSWLPSQSDEEASSFAWEDEEGVDSDSDVFEGSDFGSRRPMSGRDKAMTDEEVQSHAWLPSLLLTLLERGHALHRGVREELLLSSTSLHPTPSSAGPVSRTTSPKPIPKIPSEGKLEGKESLSATISEEEVTFALLDALQATFGRLAIANTSRTAVLMSRPGSLSYFALEILRDQAEQALRFVRRYDDSSLGLADLLTDESFEDDLEVAPCDGQGGAAKEAALLFKSLRESTDRVVNGLLRIRRLLKLRKADEEEEMFPSALSRVKIPSLSGAGAGAGAGEGRHEAGRHEAGRHESAPSTSSSLAFPSNLILDVHSTQSALAPIKEVPSSDVKSNPVSPGISGRPSISFSEALKQGLPSLPSLPAPAFPPALPPSPKLARPPTGGKPSPFAMGATQEAVKASIVIDQPKSPRKSIERPPAGAKKTSPFATAFATNLVASVPPATIYPPALLLPNSSRSKEIDQAGGFSSLQALLPSPPFLSPSPGGNKTSEVDTTPPPPPSSSVPSYTSNMMSGSQMGRGDPGLGRGDPGLGRGDPGLGRGDPGLFTIKWSELKDDLEVKIGSGAYGQVWKAKWMHDDVAVKVVSIDRQQDFDSVAIERFRQEVEIQRRLSHSNIVSFRGACCEYAEAGPRAKACDDGASSSGLAPSGASGEGITAHENSGSFTSSIHRPLSPHSSMLAIVMEYCHLGTLFKLIGRAREVEKKLKAGVQPDVRTIKTDSCRFYSSWERRLEVASGVAAGLEFMHYHSIVHRDLTSYNILINRGWFPGSYVAKICDFNLSRILPSEKLLKKSQGMANSPAWSSPEVLQGARYGFPHDVFAFGYILWEILTLRIPWSAEDEACHGGRSSDVRVALAIESVIQGRRLPLPDPLELTAPCGLPSSAASGLVEVINACWSHEPRQRPTMKVVASKLDHYLNQVKSRAKEEKLNRQ